MLLHHGHTEAHKCKEKQTMRSDYSIGLLVMDHNNKSKTYRKCIIFTLPLLLCDFHVAIDTKHVINRTQHKSQHAGRKNVNIIQILTISDLDINLKRVFQTCMGILDYVMHVLCCPLHIYCVSILVFVILYIDYTNMF